MTRIVTARPSHLLQADVYMEIGEAQDQEREISDAAALTIASWWQSPDPLGLAFAELSTTGSVNYQDLSDAIAREYDGTHTLDRLCLDMLSTWALNHPSRK